MDPVAYFEFMSKITALADQYGLTLVNHEGDVSRSPETFDIILEFIHKEYAN